MKINILKSRIKRNNLQEYAGQYFRDDSSSIITTLNKDGKQALVGIEREDGVYTIIGRKFVYYSTEHGFKGEIPIKKFSNILNFNAINKGKKGNLGYVEINEKKDIVWLYNRATMESLWNLIIWIENLPDDPNM